MFEIGFPEIVLVCIVALLVLGPERLPEALRTLGLWLGRARRSYLAVKNEIEHEIGMDEVRRQLHNEAIMEDIKRLEREARDMQTVARDSLIEPAPKPAATSEGIAAPQSPSSAAQVAAPQLPPSTAHVAEPQASQSNPQAAAPKDAPHVNGTAP